MIRGETTSAAPPTISGNVKKNGLFSAPVSSTSSVAKVIATLPSTTNFAVPSERGGSRSWTTRTKIPANARRAKIASWVSGQSPVTATIMNVARMNTQLTIRTTRSYVPAGTVPGRVSTGESPLTAA